MELKEAKIGQRVKALRQFLGVPLGTEGVIDEDYGTGVMIAWDGPPERASLPVGYSRYDNKPIIVTNILRDGFDKKTELRLLTVV